MNKTESILLVVTVGLGAAFAAAYLPGRGRVESPRVLAADGLTPGGHGAASSHAATLELLVTKRVAFTPLPPSVRNPFRPPDAGRPVREVQVALRVTAILGDRESGGDQLTALVLGELVGPQDDTSGLTIIGMSCDEARLDELLGGRRVRAGDSVDDLAELLAGRRVRQGDTIGGLRVIQVAPRGVVLAYRGERIQVRLYARGTDPGDSDHDSLDARFDETRLPTESATGDTPVGVH